jgi:O-antigen ligase
MYTESPAEMRIYRTTAFLLGASLPVSNLMMHISLVLVALCLLWRRDFRHLPALFRNPLVWLPVLMFVLLVLVSLSKPHDGGASIMSKYKKLLYVLPLGLFFLSISQLSRFFINGFLVANTIVLVISLAAATHLVSLTGVEPQNPTVFKLHITQNVFMALSAVVWLSRARARSGLARYGYILLVLLATASVLLMVQGRTGYVALFVGAGLWVLLTLNRWQSIAAVGGGMLIAAVLTLTPNRMAERLNLGAEEVYRCINAPDSLRYQACDSSMGLRTAFTRESLELIKQAPMLGHGAGGFRYDNPGHSFHNPHNEYLLVTVQSGLIGLVLFLSWVWCCFRATCRLPDEDRKLMTALLASYMACNLFNSFLLDSAEGHLFVALTAILAAVSHKRDPLTTRTG